MDDVIFSGLFEKYGICHGFSTRKGGVSSGCYESMNVGLSSGDSHDCLVKNFELLSEKLRMNLFRAAMGRQSHSDHILRIAAPAGDGTDIYRYPDTDGFITDCRNIPLAVFWADCVPVIMADKHRRAVGAVHSGWRGTVKNIAGKCVDMLSGVFGVETSDIICAMGPAVCRKCYEVSADVYRELYETAGGTGCLSAESGFYCDLQQINRKLLLNKGVREENIEIIERCTCCEAESFFSHRRMGANRGLQLAAVML